MDYVKARIVPNLLDVIDAFFQGEEGHRTDPAFAALCDRIAGKVVELRFIGTDAFERINDNYWLPNCCWELVYDDRRDAAE
jgi:hypothetical protein